MTTFSQTSGVCENNTKLTVIYFKKARESNTRPKLSEIIPWHMPLSCCSGCSEFSLKKVHDLFLFFFCCAYLSSRLSRVPLFTLLQKWDLFAHFLRFFFFFNKLCIIWRKKPAHLPSGCFLILLCSPLLCPGPCWGLPGGSAQGSAVPIAGVWALSWCSLTEKKGVSENLFAGVTGMLSGFGSVSKHIRTYECCQGVNSSLSVCFLSMSSHKRLYFH